MHRCHRLQICNQIEDFGSPFSRSKQLSFVLILRHCIKLDTKNTGESLKKVLKQPKSISVASRWASRFVSCLMYSPLGSYRLEALRELVCTTNGQVASCTGKARLRPKERGRGHEAGPYARDSEGAVPGLVQRVGHRRDQEGLGAGHDCQLMDFRHGASRYDHVALIGDVIARFAPGGIGLLKIDLETVSG